MPGDENRPPTEPDLTLSTIIDTTGPNAFKPRAAPVIKNPFCSGHTFLGDGTLLVVGGDKKDQDYAGAPDGTESGLNAVRLFEPGVDSDGRWTDVASMIDGRWYPTCTTLPDGSAFIISGFLDDAYGYNNQNPTCETYPPMGEPQYLPELVEAWPYVSYPFVFVLPSGSLFLFVKTRSFYLTLGDHAGRRSWRVTKGPELLGQPAKQYPSTATAVMLPLLPEQDHVAEIMVIGGGGRDEYPQGDFWKRGARSSCFRLIADREGERNQWRRAASMAEPRVMPDAVLLPDASVLVVGGSKNGYAGGNAGTGPAVTDDAAMHPELYDPRTDTWRSLAEPAYPRLYHSTALLLPDARVLVAGSDQQTNVNKPGFPFLDRGTEEYNKHVASAYEFRIEVFSPPYLFTGIPRPVIRLAPGRITYGEPFEVQASALGGLDEGNLRAALLRPGSVTHSNNMEQRYVGLTIERQSEERLLLHAPPRATIAPPGYYLLFIVNNGVPSEAHFVQLVAAQEEAASEYAESSAQSSCHRAAPSDGNLPSGGMAIWLRADSHVTTDANGLTTWGDRSGRGNDVDYRPNAPNDPSALPLQRAPRLVERELNGEPVVRFSVVYGNPPEQAWGGFLESRSPFLQGVGTYTGFLVLHAWPPPHSLWGIDQQKGRGPWGDLIGWGDFDNADPSVSRFVALRLGAGPRQQVIVERPPGTWIETDSDLMRQPGAASVLNYWSTEWQFGNVVTDPLVPLARAALLEFFYDGQSTGMRLNGIAIKQDAAPLKDTGAGPLRIGLSGHVPRTVTPNVVRGAFFRGDIAEVVVYERPVTEQERAAIYEYFRLRYALWPAGTTGRRVEALVEPRWSRLG